MGVVLSDFRPVHLTAPVSQEKLREIAIRFAEFVARADAVRDGKTLPPEAVRGIREAWEKYCVSPRHIASRRVSVLPDAEAAKEPDDIDFATIPFSRTFLGRKGGADIDERLAIFRGQARDALVKMYPDADAPPDELIHVSTTGYLLPSPVHELVSQKGWPSTTVSHCYHQGCYGAFPAVRMAAGALAAARSGVSQPRERVDIAHTEICSIHVAPECVDAEHIICDSLFGDGFIRYSAYSEAAFRERQAPGLEVVRYADTTIPASLDTMTWRPIANRFEMTLSVDVPRLIAAHVEPFITGLLRDTGLDSAAEKSRIIWVIHPGGPAIVELVGGCLGLSKDQITGGKDALRDGGNTSSATVPRIWNRILLDPGVPKGTPVVSMAFGPGLTATAMVARVV
jgi:predicted naringenin-chalcone synthase